MGGRISVESVVRCSWNGWPDDRGIRNQLKKFPAIQRLADLKWPSDEQLLKLSPKNKRLLLEGDLGI